jgi:hypothetical protein
MTWKCNKCSVNVDNRIDRCSFCGAAKPDDATERLALEATDKRDKLATSLHNAIHKMNPQAQLRTWRWLEDNIL